jgi:hypothetical protein
LKTLGVLSAIAGFSLIVGPALLTINGLLDNTTFTTLFVVGFVLIVLGNSNRARSSQRHSEID